MTTLNELQIGQRGRVVGYRDDDESLLQRICEMGVNRGVTVEVVRVAPLGDPIEVSLRGYQLSVRRKEAKLIEVQPVE